MSALSDQALRTALADGTLIVDPIGECAVQPASIDLRLGPFLKIPRPGQEADLSCDELPERYRDVNISEHAYPLGPGESVLGATLERIELPPHLVGLLWGRSTVARLFVQVHAAGLLDPGYAGHPTLEIVNLGPFKVWLLAGNPIAQLMVLRMDASVERPYGTPGLGSRYQGDKVPTPARSAIGGAS